MIPQFKVFMAPDVDDYVSPVLKSGYVTQGPKVEEFEDKLQKRLGYRYGLTVNSGTSALMLALRLADVGRGTNVISTPMTCSATNEAIALMGADIRWADVDIYGNMEPESVEGLIDSNTKAVVVVDWGGLPCDYAGLKMRIPLDIPIIEDAAHAFGAMYRGYSVAADAGGDYVCYSFQAIKHLTCGDGGLVVCPDSESYERGKLLRWFGLDRTSSDAMRSRQDIKEVGFKFHMNDIAAAIGLANLNHVDEILAKHRQNAKFYDQELSHVRPDWPTDRESAFWLYTLNLYNPLKFEEWMRDKGIGASQVHMRNDRYSCFFKYQKVLPGLDAFSERMCCIPVGWWLGESDIDWIISCVKEWKNKHP